MKVRVWPTNLTMTLTRFDVLAQAASKKMRALTEVMARQILHDSDNIPPMVPEETGTLRATGRVEQTPGGFAVVYGGTAPNGQSADYALQVHDDTRPRSYTRPGSGPKFVEAHFVRRTEQAPIDFGLEFAAMARQILGG